MNRKYNSADTALDEGLISKSSYERRGMHRCACYMAQWCFMNQVMNCEIL
jgi:hypothetical protein